MATALVTGASGGIGLELARIHARKGDHLILTARSEDKLKAIKNELEAAHSIQVHTLPCDLCKPGAAYALYEQVKAAGAEVDYLVNNAGFGQFGLFHEAEWAKQEEMIQLNITALTHLTHLFVPHMVRRGRGRVLNVASTAAFQPGPLMAVYFATKAYVLHFSEAIHNELSGTGVTVTALCPGPTESGFQAAAAMEESAMVKGKKLPTSAEVAAYGYRAMMQGKAVAIHGLSNKLLVLSGRLAPRSLLVKLVRSIQAPAK
jgi:short-subunit dehydrogenase